MQIRKVLNKKSRKVSNTQSRISPRGIYSKNIEADAASLRRTR